MSHVAEIVCQLCWRRLEHSEIVGTILLQSQIPFLCFWDKLVELLLVLVGNDRELQWDMHRIPQLVSCLVDHVRVPE